MAFINFQPKDYFNTKLYTGNGSANAITGVGFQPDFVWQKSRSAGEGHGLFDVLRGVTNRLQSHTTGAESSQAGSLTAFGSDGFTVGGSPNNDAANGNGQTFVSWNWKANGQGSSNTDGTINSTYTSASTTSGFSIVTYTGTNTLGATVGHGLGVAPKMIIVKSRTGGGENWNMYHATLGATKFMNLNTSTSAYTDINAWNNTAPTASVFSIGGNSGDTGRSGSDYVAYCFAEKQGFSKIGTYTGNNADDGPFVPCNFKPAWVLIFRTNGNYKRLISNNKSSPFNQVYKNISAEYADAEASGMAIDFLSNGFKLRDNDAQRNQVAPYIFMAFAEEPLVSSNGTPATAR